MPATKVPIGEETGPQIASGVRMGGSGIVTGSANLLRSMPAAGTYDTYRRMARHPTIALGLAAANAPIKAASWSYESDDDAPDEMVAFVRGVFEPLKHELVRNTLFAIRYGWQSFEKVWSIRDGKAVYSKIKPLLPDMTSVIVDNVTGETIGLKAGPDELAADKAFVYTHDQEGTDPYGNSRFENIREDAWQPWIEMQDRMKIYATKGAGVLPIVEYPVGTSLDKDGAEIDNMEVARRVIDNLGKAKGIAMPKTLEKWGEELLARGVDPSQLFAWSINFLEAAAGHGTEFLAFSAYYDSLMLRGLIVPERTAIEGTHGTLAEAEAHADIALTTSAEVLGSIVRAYNRALVNPLLVANWGPDAADSVRIVPAELFDVDKAFLRSLLTQVLVNPANVDLLLTWLDIDAALDKTDLPKAQEVIEVDPNRTPLKSEAPQEQPALASFMRDVYANRR